MAYDWKTRLRHFFTALVIGVLCGAAGGSLIKALLRSAQDGAPRPASLQESVASFRQGGGARKAEAPRTPPASSPAMDYARAVQEGDWDAVIDRTEWMRERLERVRLASGTEEAVAAERATLAAALSVRDTVGNQLQAEGVEDQYVFAPGAALEWLGTDAGHDDLERPVAERTWIRVTYPLRRRALRDEGSLPIRSITAGVNVSAEGRVLKAGVIGNLDIDTSSISYDWGPNPGD